MASSSKEYNKKYYAEHKEKALAYAKAWREANREKVRASRRKYYERWKTKEIAGSTAYNWEKMYKLSPEDYQQMFDRQGGVCKICGSAPTTRRLHVDHDHNTGDVRSLLCGKCNSGLGQFDDSPERLEEAAKYLRASTKKTKKSAVEESVASKELPVHYCQRCKTEWVLFHMCES